MSERAGSQRLRPGPVGDRAADLLGGPLDDPPRGQRIARICRELGFDAHDPGPGNQGPDGHRDATGEAATADRGEHRGDVRQVLGDLQATGALPGDDSVVVEWWDDGEPPLGGEALRHPLALAA